MRGKTKLLKSNNGEEERLWNERIEEEGLSVKRFEGEPIKRGGGKSIGVIRGVLSQNGVQHYIFFVRNGLRRVKECNRCKMVIR